MIERQALMATFIAAAAALAVAAALCFPARRALRSHALAPIAGSLALAAALVAGFSAAVRMSLGGWPDWRPIQGFDWPLHIALVALMAVALPAFGQGAISALRPVIAGIAATMLLIAGPLARTLGRRDEPEQVAWAVVLLFLLPLAASAAACAYRAPPPPEGRRTGVLARLRDDHWATLALGLMCGIGAISMLFSTSTGKSLLLGVGLAGAWAGVALAAWMLFPRLRLRDAAVVLVLTYAGLWMLSHFLSTSAHLSGLAPGLLAPLGLGAGALGPLKRRGGWLRVLVVVALVTALAGAGAALHGPAYMQQLREMEQYE